MLTAIEMKDIVQKRPHFELGPVSLDIPKGYVTAIIGPNGSGKSSLFRCILDLAKPDQGTVEVLGEKVGAHDNWQLKRRIGYVPEVTNTINDHLKAEQQAAFTRKWYPEWDINRHQELLRRFEIDASLKLRKMSKGMRRKFDLIIAMSHNPELLLLDEPSSGLDPIAWKTMIDVIHKYMDSGERTVLMASHIIEEVRRLADYIVFVVHGRVLGMYEKDTLLESWSVLYTDIGEGNVHWQSMPGYHSAEYTGGSAYKAVTSSAVEAEDWCRSQGVRIVSKQRLELDDILTALIEQERIRIQS